MLHRKLTHIGIGCLVCVGGVCGVAHPAAADDGPASAVSQYVEMIPTSNGKQSVGAKPSKAPLPSAATAALAEAEPAVAEQLTEIATSSAYGAPADAPAKRPSGAHQPSTGNGAAVTNPPSVSALGIVGDDPVTVGLVAILGISTVAMIAAAAAGRRGGITASRTTGK